VENLKVLWKEEMRDVVVLIEEMTDAVAEVVEEIIEVVEEEETNLQLANV
jgi:hypothetical protein